MYLVFFRYVFIPVFFLLSFSTHANTQNCSLISKTKSQPSISYLKQLFKKNEDHSLVVAKTVVGSYIYTCSCFDKARLGGAGDDSRLGGAGDDARLGGAGDDSRLGGAGDDARLGGAGDDARLGGAGDDARLGGAGDDARLGGAGDDARLGGAGDDSRLGGAGDDSRLGGAGDDSRLGGGGDDARLGGRSFGLSCNIDGQGDYELYNPQKLNLKLFDGFVLTEFVFSN